MKFAVTVFNIDGKPENIETRENRIVDQKTLKTIMSENRCTFSEYELTEDRSFTSATFIHKVFDVRVVNVVKIR